MPGKAEVEHDDVGMVAGREVERVLAVGREVDVVAAGAQVDAERAQDLRLVVDDEHAGHDGATSRLMTIVTPPPGRVVDRDLAAHRLDEPARDREAEPDAACRWSCRRAAGTAGTRARAAPAGSRHRGRRRGGRPAPSATHASTRTRVSGGDHAERVLDDVGDRAFEQRGVGLDARQRLGHVDVDALGLRSSPARAAGTTSSSATVAHHELQRAGLEPAHVEQVADQVVEPVGALVDGLEQLPGGGRA